MATFSRSTTGLAAAGGGGVGVGSAAGAAPAAGGATVALDAGAGLAGAAAPQATAKSKTKSSGVSKSVRDFPNQRCLMAVPPDSRISEGDDRASAEPSIRQADYVLDIFRWLYMMDITYYPPYTAV